MTSSMRASALALAIVAVGCSSADGQSASDVPAAVRVRSVAGAELGLAYDLQFSWQFQQPGAPGTNATTQLVLLKEVPAGTTSPILVFRSLFSGGPLLCNRFFAAADCTGTPTVQPPHFGTACASDGRMWKADFTGVAGSIDFGSAEYARWDTTTREFLVECVPGTASTPPIVFPAVDVGPERSSPGRLYIVPAD